MNWMLLGLAIVLEVTGTLSMRASEGFSRGWFTLLTVGTATGFGIVNATVQALACSGREPRRRGDPVAGRRGCFV